MIDSIDFINDHINIYCGHDIYTYNIIDLYIIRYTGTINKGYSVEYILYVRDTEDRFIIPIDLLDVFIHIGINLSV